MVACGLRREKFVAISLIIHELEYLAILLIIHNLAFQAVAAFG